MGRGSRTRLAAMAATLLVGLGWTSAATGAGPGRRGLPEGHAGRQHAESDGARRRPRRARLLHRARRTAPDLEAEHTADRHGRHGGGHQSQENGLLGLQLAPDFAFSRWVYLFYSLLPDSTTRRWSRASRSTATRWTWLRAADPHLPAPDARVLPLVRLAVLRPRRSLYISTGDNTNPFDSSGFNPIDERAGREDWDAQRTAANTNDLNGKILRIKPMDDPARHAGRRHDLHDPRRQPLRRAADTDNKTRPEIFGMGFRNPFRFTVDPETGWVLMGDYGPDATPATPTAAPRARRVQRAPSSGNYGWPYCIRDNTRTTTTTSRPRPPAPSSTVPRPVNDSPTTPA